MKFSQREGLVPIKKVIQKESMDQSLRNGLWNVLTLYCWEAYEQPSSNDYYFGSSDLVKGSNIEYLMKLMWVHYFKLPVDEIQDSWSSCLSDIRAYFFKTQWFHVYDFIEFVIDESELAPKDEIVGAFNFTLERENSAYRIVNGVITELTSDEEIESIENAITSSAPFYGVKSHLNSAVVLYADKQSPDYRNSIKESISAVESLVKQVSNESKATLGEVLKKMEKEGRMHTALKQAFSSLYGYTSDAGGIRHALLDEDNLTKSEAKFMLVCCSAFINYVIETTKFSE